MTDKQKQQIQDMRIGGASYSQISEKSGLSMNTVKSFCLRNKLVDMNVPNNSEEDLSENKYSCKQCGGNLGRPSKTKPKTFCSSKCRCKWWSANRNPPTSLTCAYCGVTFSSYNKERKFCGHPCYINSRFKGGLSDDQRAV